MKRTILLLTVMVAACRERRTKMNIRGHLLAAFALLLVLSIVVPGSVMAREARPGSLVSDVSPSGRVLEGGAEQGRIIVKYRQGSLRHNAGRP
jgi:hypothetical protein